MGSLFIFVYCFLCCAKAFEFRYVPFVFISIILGDGLKKGTAMIYVKECLPMFSCKSFIVSSPF